MDSTKASDKPTKSGSSGLFKLLSFLFLAMFILFMTDSVEIKNNNQEFKAGIVVKRKNMTELTNSLSQTASSLGNKWKESAMSSSSSSSSSPPPPPPANSAGATESSGSKPSSDESGSKQPTSTEGDGTKETGELPSATKPTTESGGTQEMVETPASSAGSSGTTSSTETASSSTNKETSSVKEAAITAQRYTYQRRGQPMNDTDKTPMIQKWGSWTLDNAAARSKGPSATTDYYLKYPNRDVPRDEFPATAWQKDTKYIEQFLQEGLALMERAMEAILAEYGHGRDDQPNDSFEVRSDMFLLQTIDDAELLNAYFNPKQGPIKGGWTTPRSWLGLQRRLLHAIMTEDTFVFVMGGHSSSAGHGNLFAQSYTLQVARIMEPIFARLGVKHEARNFGNGGLGTVQNAMGMASIYGPDIDFLMWDSGMTEPEEGAVDLFARQGLLGGHKVPFLYSLNVEVLRKLHHHAQVDVAGIGDAMSGIPEVEEFDQLEKEPYARRYLNCAPEIKGTHCQPYYYNSVCWIDRDDFKPPMNQSSIPGGRAGWHPGNRFHQLAGRVISFTLLKALRDALTTWSQAEGQVLPDEAWHVTDYYNTIRQKVKDLDPSVTACGKYVEAAGMEPFLCTYPFQGRTEFTPRFNPGQSSIRSLMTTDTLQHINSPPEIAYHPPDVLIPALHPPPGEVDVLNIVEAGLEFVSTLDPSLQYHPGYYDLLPPQSMPKSLELPPGKGIHLVSVAGDQFCDGTLNSWCHKGADDNCLLSGHNDGRNCLVFDGYSGWIKMVIPKVKYGYILLRLETWGASNANPATDTYTSVNNVTDASQQRVRRRRRLQRPVAPEFNGTILRRTNATATLYGNDDRDYRIDYDLMDSSVNTTSAGQRLSRRLKKKYVPPSFCDEFRFEYALDGTITSLNLEGFNSKKSQLQRVVEAVTILANKEYLQGKDEADIEFAFRIVGCRRIITFHLSHVYWA